jgi:uncharacterized protein
MKKWSLVREKLPWTRVIFLTIPILFSPLSGADETDSLLFYLSVRGPVIELARCIGKCSSPNIRRSNGLTPLMAAVQANNPSTVGVLMKHGADASLTDSMNFDALYWALQKGFYRVADVILAHGVDVDHPNSQGNSPLLSAAMQGNCASANYLLQHGADRTRKSAAGATPMDIASRNHDGAMVHLLLSFRPDQQHLPAADTGAGDAGSSFTDAKTFIAAVQSGRRDFRSCSITNMDLKGMRLYGLNLKSADLSGCDLRGADMRHCILDEAVLRNAYLHGTDLRFAQMENTDFGDALLTGADLRDVTGLSFGQLRGARNLYKTKLDSETVEVMQREYPHLFKDPGGAWKVPVTSVPDSK